MATNALLLNYPVLPSHLQSAALAPDGKSVAVLEDRTITFVDVATGKPTRTLTTRTQYGRLAFSPDGRKIALAGNGGPMQLFDVGTGQAVATSRGEFDLTPIDNGYAGDLSFRPDGMLLARLPGVPGVSVWNPRTGGRVGTIGPPTPEMGVGWLSPDARHILSGVAAPRSRPIELRIWDRATRTVVASAAFPGVHWPRLMYSRDGRLFMHLGHEAQDAPEVRELNPATLETLRAYRLTGGPFGYGTRSSVYPADGLTRFEIAYSGNRPGAHIRQWNLATGVEAPPIRWSPDEALATAADDARLGDVRYLRNYSVSADGRWVCVLQFIGRRGPPRWEGDQGIAGAVFVSVFDAADGRERVRFPVRHNEDSQYLHSATLILSPDGRFAALTGVGPLRLYETASGTERRRLHGSDPLFSPDGRLLVTNSGADGWLVWDMDAPAAGADPDGANAAWEALAQLSAARAYPAMRWLCARPDEAVRLLAAGVRPTVTPTAEQVAAWIEQLGADDFREREEADRLLRGVASCHAERFGNDLRAALARHPSPEARDRLGRVLKVSRSWEPLAEEVRAARAVEVLERIGTPAARAVLVKWAEGPADAWLTRDAGAALDRTR